MTGRVSMRDTFHVTPATVIASPEWTTPRRYSTSTRAGRRGRRPYRVEESSQNVNSNAGILLVKQLPCRIQAFEKFNGCQPSLKPIPCQKFSNAGVAKDAVALMTLGTTSFSGIAAHQKDDLFAEAVGEAVPSEATFRQRLGYLAILPRVRDWVDEENVGFTYHKVDGFAPIFATVGTLGYQLANELRPGNQHSQKGFPEFLRRCAWLVRQFCPRDVKILLRLDSAHDSDDTLETGYALDDEIGKAVESSGLAFIVRRVAFEIQGHSSYPH